MYNCTHFDCKVDHSSLPFLSFCFTVFLLFVPDEEEYLGLDVSKHGERAMAISPSHADLTMAMDVGKDPAKGNAAA